MRRLALAALLTLALLGLGVHYGAVADRHDPVRVSGAMLDDPGAHAGERVYVWGRVAGRTEGVLVVRSGGHTLRVRGTAPRADHGDVVQVAGTLRAGGRIDADRVVVSERAGLRRLYAVSAVGLLAAVGTLARRWRIDPERLALVRRDR